MAAKKTDTKRISTETSITATASKTKKGSAGKKRNPGDYPAAYIRFRTVLDAMEIIALRYSLSDADPAKRIRRAQEIEGELMPLIRKYEKKLELSNATAGECPDGFYNCGGCC